MTAHRNNRVAKRGMVFNDDTCTAGDDHIGICTATFTGTQRLGVCCYKACVVVIHFHLNRLRHIEHITLRRTGYLLLDIAVYRFFRSPKLRIESKQVSGSLTAGFNRFISLKNR